MPKSFYTTHSGALFVSPGGQSEQGPQMKAAGFSWGAIDVVDGHGWGDWKASISSMAGAGLRVPVWGRVQNASIQQIMEVAIANHSPCILDIESEFKNGLTPARAEQEILRVKALHPTWTREIVLNTNGWLYNSVDYSALAHRPVQLQVMAEDMGIAPSELPRVTADCIAHAQVKGFRDIGITFQSFHDAVPAWYAFWTKPRNYFAGDVIGAGLAWPEWAVSA